MRTTKTIPSNVPIVKKFILCTYFEIGNSVKLSPIENNTYWNEDAAAKAAVEYLKYNRQNRVVILTELALSESSW